MTIGVKMNLYWQVDRTSQMSFVECGNFDMLINMLTSLYGGFIRSVRKLKAKENPQPQ